MSIQHAEPTTAHQVRRQAAQVLMDLTAEDLPEVTWRLHRIGRFLDLYVSYPQDHDLLDGHANSHQAVRAWAAHLGVDVELRYGDTPTAQAVLDGIGVCVWCAPERRDDLPRQ